MSEAPRGDVAALVPITELLGRARAGDDAALELVMPLVYDELRGLAHRQLRRLPSGETLNTTALVHEAFLKMARGREPAFQNRCHFFAVAATAMRQIVIDYAREKATQKRGGDRIQVPLHRVEPSMDDRPELLLAIDEALTRLTILNPRLGRVVECRFFGGLTEEETAAALSITDRTVRRDWVKARAWLYRELRLA